MFRLFLGFFDAFSLSDLISYWRTWLYAGKSWPLKRRNKRPHLNRVDRLFWVVAKRTWSRMDSKRRWMPCREGLLMPRRGAKQ